MDELSEVELQDLRERLTYVGYPPTEEITELKSILSLFLEDRSLGDLSTKEELWIELVNYGYKLGDRILTKTNPGLYGADVEELQELLSRLGFYSEPINGIFTNDINNLSNDFFVNLLDMSTEWKPSKNNKSFSGYDRKTGENSKYATRVDLIFGSNSQLRAIAMNNLYHIQILGK